MILNTRLNELISRWESSGGRATPEELCADSPELLEPLRDCISRLGSIEHYLHGADASEPPPRPDIPGYEIREFIGRGGMGTVWRAVQLGTRRDVALKVISAGEFATTRARMRFEREVELASRLNHPNIARVYDSGVHRGAFYYAMELIEQAVHLDRFVEQRALSRAETLALFRPICSAVQHAHQLGVIHRDLKPSNILVDPRGEPHLLDFGLAKEAWSETDSTTQLTLDDTPAGTPAYMSPEQARGESRRVGTASDVYTLGVILFRLLLGRLPHDVSGSGIEVMHRIATTEPARPRSIHRTFPRDLEAILLKALARTQDERYASADALSVDLSRWLDGLPCAPLGRWYHASKLLRKNRRAILIATAATIVVTSAGLTAHTLIEQQRRRATEANRALKEVNAPHVRALQEYHRGNLAHAEHLFRKSLQHAIEHYGEDSVEVLNDRGALFILLRQQNRFQEAQFLIDDCERVLPRKLASTQPFDATWFFGYAEGLAVTGLNEHALAVLERAAPTAIRSLPPDDPARRRLLADLDSFSRAPTSPPAKSD